MRASWALLCLLGTCFGRAAGWQYGLVVDAGSSGSRMNIFAWPLRTANTVPDVEPAPPPPPNQVTWSKKITPGISVFAVAAINASAVQAYLQPLVDYAASKVPASQHRETPLYLFATAGMRMVDPTLARNLYLVVRASLATGPFLFQPQWARTISGEEEGVYGWITVNAARDVLDADPANTWGALDLGGASTQITFVPLETPLAGYFDQQIASTSFPLYTHSYLNFGQDRLLARLLASLAFQNATENPCRLTGYRETPSGVPMVGAYNAERCKAVIRPLLGLGQYCPVAPCTMWSIYQPPIPDSMQLSLFSAFAYAATFFNCSDMQHLGCVDEHAVAWCNATDFAAAVAVWSSSVPVSFLVDYCAQAAYQSILLTEAYGLLPNRTVRYAALDGTWELSWALGAMMAMEGGYFCPASFQNSTGTNGRAPDSDLVLILSVLLGVACFAVLVLLVLLFFICCRAPGAPRSQPVHQPPSFANLSQTTTSDDRKL